MRLREIIAELIDKKFATQTALAQEVNPLPEGIEPAKPADIQRMANAGRNQEKQFAIVMKLLPLCKELGIDPAQELNIEELEKEGSHDVEQEVDRQAGRAHPGAKKRRKKAAAGGFQARRIEGHRGRER